MAKNGKWDEAAVAKAMRASALQSLARKADPDYLAEVVKAANSAGSQAGVDDALDAFNAGRKSR